MDMKFMKIQFRVIILATRVDVIVVDSLTKKHALNIKVQIKCYVGNGRFIRNLWTKSSLNLNVMQS